MSTSLRRLVSDYGMLAVLLLLGLVFSGLTLEEQSSSDAAAARRVAAAIRRDCPERPRVLVAVRGTPEDGLFADALRRELDGVGAEVVDVVRGEPQAARAALEKLAQAGGQDVITTATGNPLEAEPGRRWKYANNDTLLLMRALRHRRSAP